MTTVLVCGGGIAGLTTAHELIKRGFEVTVIESRDHIGGKARSIDVPGTVGKTGRSLPGEHGFRFFPGFYKHLDETLADIPYPGNQRGVLDNLRTTTEMLLSRAFEEDIELPSEPPSNIKEVWTLLKAFTSTLGISPSESIYFGKRMIEFLSSCDDRRLAEFDKISWWDFIGAEKKSDGYQRFLGQGVTRSLVAMKAEISSTRTIAAIYFQMVSHLMSPTSDVDRLLNGPTNDVMLLPWEKHLTELGVKFVKSREVTKLIVGNHEILGIETKKKGRKKTYKADYYVAALPMEVISKLLTPQLLAEAPTLGGLEFLQTEWMNGLQFFMDSDVPMSRGHGLFLDSPWALTSISQAQFWESEMTSYGDGNVKGILSMVISDWNTKGVVYGKPASECSAEEIKDEVWEQLMQHVDNKTRRALSEANIIDWFLDDSIVHPNPHTSVNLEPLLINTVDSWKDRPAANIGLKNTFLASDYVRTNTDLATMEGANEAAKRAVNEILQKENYNISEYCNIMTFDEWTFFKPLKQWDQLRFDKGKNNLFKSRS